MAEELEDSGADRRVVGRFERHLQTAAFTIMVLLLAWIGNKAHETALGIEKLTEKVNGLVEREAIITDNLKDRCLSAEQDIELLRERFQLYEDRLRGVELRVIEHQHSLNQSEVIKR